MTAKTVLIVDDEAPIREIIVVALQQNRLTIVFLKRITPRMPTR